MVFIIHINVALSERLLGYLCQKKPKKKRSAVPSLHKSHHIVTLTPVSVTRSDFTATTRRSFIARNLRHEIMTGI